MNVNRREFMSLAGLSAIELAHLMGSPSAAPAILDIAGIKLAGSLTDEELELKALCEFSLHEFIKTFWRFVEPDRPFIDGWHIQALCLHLEALYENKFDSLMVLCPPGVMKSLACSVFFPAWCWARNPAWRTMSFSYEQTLSTRDSLRCRMIIRSRLYRRLWPEAGQLKRDQDAKTRYENVANGWRIASSVGGRGTGEHPDCLICDDSAKAQDAMSERARESVKEWWDGTTSTRGTMRGVRRLVIQQRLHPDDLPGHIETNEPDDFVIVCLPMRAEPDRMKRTPLGWIDPRKPGELLWPGGFPEDKVRKVEKRLGSSLRIAGQLQQRPKLLEGGLFKGEWFRWEADMEPTEAERELDRLLRAG